jgi:hypothetical protein
MKPKDKHNKSNCNRNEKKHNKSNCDKHKDKHNTSNCDRNEKHKRAKRILTPDELSVKSIINQTVTNKTESLYNPMSGLEKFADKFGALDWLKSFTPDRTGQITSLLSQVMLLLNFFTREDTVNELNNSTTKIRKFMAKPKTKKKIRNILANLEDLKRKTGDNSVIYKCISILYDIRNEYSLLAKSKEKFNDSVLSSDNFSTLTNNTFGLASYIIKKNVTFIISKNIGFLLSKKQTSDLFAAAFYPLLVNAIILSGTPVPISALISPPIDAIFESGLVEIMTGSELDLTIPFAKEVARKIMVLAQSENSGGGGGPGGGGGGGGPGGGGFPGGSGGGGLLP